MLSLQGTYLERTFLLCSRVRKRSVEANCILGNDSYELQNCNIERLKFQGLHLEIMARGHSLRRIAGRFKLRAVVFFVATSVNFALSTSFFLSNGMLQERPVAGKYLDQGFPHVLLFCQLYRS